MPNIALGRIRLRPILKWWGWSDYQSDLRGPGRTDHNRDLGMEIPPRHLDKITGINSAPVIQYELIAGRLNTLIVPLIAGNQCEIVMESDSGYHRIGSADGLPHAL